MPVPGEMSAIGRGADAAHAARIYWDAGTGTVHFPAPHATVLVDYLTTATPYTWQSQALANEQAYRFVVRIARAPWPDSVETQNLDEHAAVANSSVPAAPVLTTQVI